MSPTEFEYPPASPSVSVVDPSPLLGDHGLDPCLERLIRSGSTPLQAASLASIVLGRPVTAEYVSSLKERQVLARAKLSELVQKPQLAQRTPEWHAARREMITASDAAQALGCAKFGTQRDFFVKKCGSAEEQKAFDASAPPLKWGVMFEPVALSVYKHVNLGVEVHEFGLLRHDSIGYLGASPDGVTEDGVMVEIKCPWRRKIDGKVPQQYYYQIQGQLEVSGLRDCDYFECEFREAPLRDDVQPWTRGVFIEFIDIVKDVSDNSAGYVSRYVYPPQDSLSWSVERLCEWAKTTSDSDKSCVAARERWWRLVRWSSVRVIKDEEFVSDMVHRLGEIWEKVISYRQNSSAYDENIKAPAATRAKKPRAKKAQDEGIAGYAFVDDA